MGTFKINDVFYLTGRGPVLIGNLVNGDCIPGNYIELLFKNDKLLFQINYVEAVRSQDNPIGLRISDNPDIDFKYFIGQIGVLKKN